MKNIKIVFATLIIGLLSLNSYAQSDVAGEWIIGEQNTVVKIEQLDGLYSGKITSSDNPKAEIGKLMVKEISQSKDKWKGKVYSPKRKEWYDAEFTTKENKLMIEIKVGFFSKTTEWTRK